MFTLYGYVSIFGGYMKYHKGDWVKFKKGYGFSNRGGFREKGIYKVASVRIGISGNTYLRLDMGNGEVSRSINEREVIMAMDVPEIERKAGIHEHTKIM